VLNVAGHVRLQDAACVEQFDMQASEEASANLNLLALIAPSFANAVPSSAHRMAVAKVSFMSASLAVKVPCKALLHTVQKNQYCSQPLGPIFALSAVKFKNRFSRCEHRLIHFAEDFRTLFYREWL
jgi:hypothetical protein